MHEKCSSTVLQDKEQKVHPLIRRTPLGPPKVKKRVSVTAGKNQPVSRVNLPPNGSARYKTGVVLVDYQEPFLAHTSSNHRSIATDIEKIVRHVKEDRLRFYRTVFAFKNDGFGSDIAKNTFGAWSSELADVGIETPVIERHSYGFHKVGLCHRLSQNGLKRAIVCGLQTEIAVLACGIAMWDHGIMPFLWEPGTATSSGANGQASGVSIWKSAFGAESVIQSAEELATFIND